MAILIGVMPDGLFCVAISQIAYSETLDVADLRAIGCIDEEPQNYALYGVVVHIDHMNSTMYGHYIAYIRCNDGNWYLCDDSSVTKV
eukprot:scaffold155582_cov37-Prasinocladus_malaysianus.AAC.1